MAWEVLSADIFHFNNKNYLCIVDYHSKFPVIKRMEWLSTESLIATTNVIFSEYGIPHKLMSDAGTNFISDKSRKFCSRFNIEQVVSSHITTRAMGRSKPALKFIKCTLKKCADSSGDIHTALLQIHTTPLGQGLPSLATLLFNSLVHSIMPVIDRKPVGGDNDDEHHSKLIYGQHKNNTNNDTSPVFASIPIGSTVVVQ